MACIFCPVGRIKIPGSDIRAARQKNADGVAIGRSTNLQKKVRAFIPDFSVSDTRYPSSICRSCQKLARKPTKEFKRNAAFSVFRAESLSARPSRKENLCNPSTCYICANVEACIANARKGRRMSQLKKLNRSLSNLREKPKEPEPAKPTKRDEIRGLLALSCGVGCTTSDV